MDVSWLAIGFAFLFQQAALDIWSGNNFDINPPGALTRSVVVGGLYLPLYRIFMIVLAAVIGVALLRRQIFHGKRHPTGFLDRDPLLRYGARSSLY